MLRRLHANATTTPKVRAEIQASTEPVAIRRWRGRTGTEDRSHIRHDLGQATTPVEEAIIVELRTLAGLSLDDVTR